MSTFGYASLKVTATQLIDRFGREMTLRQRAKTGSGYDPTITNSDSTITAAAVSFKQSEVDGTKIQMSDKKIIFTSDIQITSDMQIIDDSKVYSLMPVKEVDPGDTPVLYIVRGRVS